MCYMVLVAVTQMHGLDILCLKKNKPASFKQPLYSFISDWRMLSDVAMGRLSLIDRKHDKIPS